MFIWTISDVAAVIIFVAIIAYIIYTLISGHIATKEVNRNNSIEYKKSAKAESEHKDNKNEPPTWGEIIIGAIVFYGIIYLLTKI